MQQQRGPWGPTLSRRAALAGIVPSAALAATLGTAAPAWAAPAPPKPVPPTGAEPDEGLDVRRFGAMGDGTTDDGPAIQRALTQAATAGPALVVVPPGTYRVATPLSAKAPIGLGGWSGTTIAFDSSLATGLLLEQPSNAVVYPGPAIQVEDLGFDYAGSGTAVELNESALSSPFQDTLIRGCRFSLGGPGTAILSVNQRDAIITACQFLGSNSRAATGIALSDSDNTKVEDNVFYNLLYGVHGVRAANRVFDAGCLFIGNSMYGFVDALHFEGWELVQAVGNIVDGATGNCFHLLDCYHSVIADNYLGINGSANGVLIETQQPYGVGFLGQIAFTGNYLNHYEGASGQAAIAVYGVSALRPEDQVLIDGNIVNGYPTHGVHLRNAQNVMVRGNILSAAASGAVSVYDETPGKNHILDNIIDGPIVASGDTVLNNFTKYPYPS